MSIGDYDCVFYPSDIFCNTWEKMLVNSLHLLFFTVVKNPLIPVSDWDRISPYYF